MNEALKEVSYAKKASFMKTFTGQLNFIVQSFPSPHENITDRNRTKYNFKYEMIEKTKMQVAAHRDYSRVPSVREYVPRYFAVNFKFSTFSQNLFYFFLLFFIFLPCILISTKFIHQQIHSLLNLTKF
jgi:hypothetical protein